MALALALWLLFLTLGPRRSDPRRPNRVVEPVDPLAWAGLAGAVWLAGPMLASVAWAFIGAGEAPTPAATRAEAQSASLSERAFLAGWSGLGGLAAAACAWWFVGRAAPRAGFTARWIDAGIGAGALALVMVAVVLVGRLADATQVAATGAPLPDAGVAHATLRAIVASPADARVWVLIAGAIVVAPIVEEVVYRGLIQSALARATGRVVLPVLLSTGVFVAAHLIGAGAVPWYAAVRIALVGLACGLLFERTASLAAPIVLHAGFNAANVVLALTLTTETP